MNSAALEIIIPVATAGAEWMRTAASLIAQTDRRFSVLLGDALPPDETTALNEAERKLAAAGIVVRRLKVPLEFKAPERWNWLHAQSSAEWLKPLAPGERLQPAYVAALLQRIAENPRAQFIRCDAEIQTEWGPEIPAAPFERDAITPAEFVTVFPARIDWISRSVNVAYRRVAWRATGGYPPQFPACAALNLNVILALHYGVENIARPLTTANYADPFPLNAGPRARVNFCLELWLVLRQAHNYCLAAKIAWPQKCLLAQSLSAAWRRL